jgi:SPP1 gp7 family putative phage head morphogenesis protein
LGKVDDAERKKVLDEVMAAINAGDVSALVGDMADLLDEIYRDGAAQALAQVGITSDASIVDLVNQKAVDYANARAAEMVGMKWVDGELVDNPNAEWRIDEATRELLRADVTDAMESGMSNDDLATQLEDSYAFSADRAETIARTETAYADVQGNLAGYTEAGVDQKQWVTGDGCCDDCDALNGVIVDMDEDFPDDGGDGPPLHPNCRCDVLPVLSTDDTTE